MEGIACAVGSACSPRLCTCSWFCAVLGRHVIVKLSGLRRRGTRASIMSQTDGYKAAWPDFLVALFLWGPDTQGQLLKAAGYTFRAAAAVPTALIHFMISIEGYPVIYEKVREYSLLRGEAEGAHMKTTASHGHCAAQVQETYPDQLAACIAAAHNALRYSLLPTAAHAVQTFITGRTLCYGVST